MKFKHWFESNEILPFPSSTIKYPVYHGTDKPIFQQFAHQKGIRQVLFSQFEVEAKGFFFAESPHEALEYGRNIAECYVDLKNPLLDPRRDKHMGIDNLPYEKELHLMKILAPMIEWKDKEPYIDIGVRRIWLRNRRYEKANQWIYEAVGMDGLDWDCLDNPQVIQNMKKLGYDGTFVQENQSRTGRSIFVPDANQIRIVKWVKGFQPSWGEEEEYYTQKNKEGYSHFYGPEGKYE
jgi:hypothetical protein